ncbi:hypothetical protein BU15DRAFT_67692 [Melanogaster broomeanus]|nr:hypothetical protein BU15DRAFT_67692 [Melanogaster broomeanus]
MAGSNHDVNEATRRMIQAAAYSGETRDRSDEDDSDLYSSVSSGAHEESPESGGDSAFRGEDPPMLSGSSNGGLVGGPSTYQKPLSDTQEKCPNGNSNAATASNQAQHTRNVTSRPKTYHLAPNGARPIRNISHKPNGTGDRR